MKFVPNSITKCAPRLGVLKDIDKFPNTKLETPLTMLYTRGGSIPHITNEVFKLVCKGQHIIQLPLVSTHDFEEAMSNFDGNIADFVGMKQCISSLTVQDPADDTIPGHHIQGSVPLWTKNGKVLINAKLYMNVVESFKPDMYYLLSDGDTNIASSSRRVNKAVENTIKYSKECLERHQNSKVLKNAFVIGSIAGGYSFQARQDCIKNICDNNIISGYLIDGLHNNGPNVELETFEKIQPIVKFVIENLPQEKLRVVHGCWNPSVIINLVKLGIDMFDTSYCHFLTEKFIALVFSTDLTNITNNEYELNLCDPQFADDFKPILSGCTCLTCEKYSRGYIHHLYTTKELLGSVLLSIHNVHHYLNFFEKIRECLKNNTLDILKEKIDEQFNANLKEITIRRKFGETPKNKVVQVEDKK